MDCYRWSLNELDRVTETLRQSVGYFCQMWKSYEQNLYIRTLRLFCVLFWFLFLFLFGGGGAARVK